MSINGPLALQPCVYQKEISCLERRTAVARPCRSSRAIPRRKNHFANNNSDVTLRIIRIRRILEKATVRTDWLENFGRGLSNFHETTSYFQTYHLLSPPSLVCRTFFSFFCFSVAPVLSSIFLSRDYESDEESARNPYDTPV